MKKDKLSIILSIVLTLLVIGVLVFLFAHTEKGDTVTLTGKEDGFVVQEVTKEEPESTTGLLTQSDTEEKIEEKTEDKIEEIIETNSGENYEGPPVEKKTGWYSEGGAWYYYDENGSKVTGLHEIEDKWYFFDPAGVMQTGWVKHSGKWYFMDEHGVIQTGWVQNSGKWYFMDVNGVMQTGWITVDGTEYYLDENGVYIKDKTR